MASNGTYYKLMVRAEVFTGFDICDQSIRNSDQRRRQAFTYLKGSGPNTEHILRFFASNSSYAQPFPRNAIERPVQIHVT
jgi:hypothetical protein